MAAGPDDLCTLADLKAWLPNQGNNDDVNLQALITNASTVILNEYLNRPHILASVIGMLNETYDGNGSFKILPHFFPIISVTSVTVDGVPIPASTSPVAAGFGWDSRKIFMRGFRFDVGMQNVALTYTAGYASVPLDIKQAAVEAFALTYRQRTHIGEKSNSMQGQVTVSYDLSELPPRAIQVFNQYRRIAL